jgi:hypothetical protein
VLDEEREIGYRQYRDYFEGKVELVGIFLNFLVDFITPLHQFFNLGSVIRFHDCMMDMGELLEIRGLGLHSLNDYLKVKG